MNEVQAAAFEEDASLGRALMQELNKWCGLEDENVERISRAIYKGTSCGAWLAIDDEGLKVGSIVEGSDVDCETHTLDWVSYARMDEGDLGKWLSSALDEIEAEAAILWVQADGDEEGNLLT